MASNEPKATTAEREFYVPAPAEPPAAVDPTCDCGRSDRIDGHTFERGCDAWTDDMEPPEVSGPDAGVLSARIGRALALLDAWGYDAPGLVDPTFAGRLRELLKRDPVPIRTRGNNDE